MKLDYDLGVSAMVLIYFNQKPCEFCRKIPCAWNKQGPVNDVGIFNYQGMAGQPNRPIQFVKGLSQSPMKSMGVFQWAWIWAFDNKYFDFCNLGPAPMSRQTCVPY